MIIFGTRGPISKELAQQYAAQAEVFRRPTPQPLGQFSPQPPVPPPTLLPPQPPQ
jgi:hypothetical protein